MLCSRSLSKTYPDCFVEFSSLPLYQWHFWNRFPYTDGHCYALYKKLYQRSHTFCFGPCFLYKKLYTQCITSLKLVESQHWLFTRTSVHKKITNLLKITFTLIVQTNHWNCKVNTVKMPPFLLQSLMVMFSCLDQLNLLAFR